MKGLESFEKDRLIQCKKCRKFVLVKSRIQKYCRECFKLKRKMR